MGRARIQPPHLAGSPNLALNDEERAPVDELQLQESRLLLLLELRAFGAAAEVNPVHGTPELRRELGLGRGEAPAQVHHQALAALL